jgi:hypothetical protein
MSFNNSFSLVTSKQMNPLPPSKTLEWTFVECINPLSKHEALGNHGLNVVQKHLKQHK